MHLTSCVGELKFILPDALLLKFTTTLSNFVLWQSGGLEFMDVNLLVLLDMEVVLVSLKVGGLLWVKEFLTVLDLGLDV